MSTVTLAAVDHLADSCRDRHIFYSPSRPYRLLVGLSVLELAGGPPSGLHGLRSCIGCVRLTGQRLGAQPSDRRALFCEQHSGGVPRNAPRGQPACWNKLNECVVQMRASFGGFVVSQTRRSRATVKTTCGDCLRTLLPRLGVAMLGPFSKVFAASTERNAENPATVQLADGSLTLSTRA